MDLPHEYLDTGGDAVFGRAIDDHRQGRLDLARSGYRRFLARRPGSVEALYFHGCLRQHAGDQVEASRSLRRALAFEPTMAACRRVLAECLRLLGDLSDEVEQRRALALEPSSRDGHDLYGALATDRGRYLEAVRAHRRALAIGPVRGEALHNLGNAYRFSGEVVAARRQYRSALALEPMLVEAHWNAGLTDLTLGEWVEGWPGYERRWHNPTLLEDIQVHHQPRWGGGTRSEARVLLWAEQGLGDTLQFVRYARLVRQRVGQVILQVPPTLKRLLADVAGVDVCVTRDEALPAFDLHCPLGSLPKLFGTTVATIPGPAPYLTAPAEEVARWAERFTGLKGPRIGICWKGNPRFLEDRMRSPGFDAIQPLLSALPGSAISLVKDPNDDDLAARNLLDLSTELIDMATTAAVMANLDLVITSDTSIVHLAGALGRPTWLLLHHASDWRWLTGRSDSPWYPSISLFRQEAPGDWRAPVQRIAEGLRTKAFAHHRA